MEIMKMTPASLEWKMGNSIDVYFADSEMLEKGYSQVRVSIDFESNKSSDDFKISGFGNIYAKGLRFEFPGEIPTIFDGTSALTHSSSLTKNEKIQIAKEVFEKYKNIWEKIIKDEVQR